MQPRKLNGEPHKRNVWPFAASAAAFLQGSKVMPCLMPLLLCVRMFFLYCLGGPE